MTASSTTSTPVLQLQSVSKLYAMGTNTIVALEDVSITVAQGEFLAVVGPSGSGKSTFLQIASMLARPTSGTILLNGQDVTTYNEVENARLRNQEIGFVFQQFNLLPKTSALDNVRLPLIYAHMPEKEQRRRAKRILTSVGLEDRLNNTPAQLSGGQQQRVAIARALVNEPSIIFADEPTGNLDSKSGDEIMSLFSKLHKESTTIILVTHDLELARVAQRIISFKDGKIVSIRSTAKKKRKSKP